MAERITYTCDRCGKDYEKSPRWTGLFGTVRTRLPQKIIVDSVDKYGYLSDKALASLPKVDSVEAIVGYQSKSRDYDLCPDCARELEKFLNNK